MTSFYMAIQILSSSDRLKLERGNILLRKTAILARACVKANIPFTIENPHSSRVWLTKEITRLEALGATHQVVHYCQYNKPWKKATTFFGWNIPRFDFKTCKGSHGICSATLSKHVILQGRNRDGVFRTLIAQPYPSKLVQHMASQLALYL